jgi:type I restriction enzyme S subunit
MTLETFFETFDQFAEAPNAVAKMRELILQLAAHGKLVEHSHNDEPASVLLARIEKHLQGLRSRKLLRCAPVEPLDRDDLPEIPQTWQWVRLGNVADYGSSDKAESADIPENAWLLDLEDIEKDTSRLLQRKSFRDSPSKSTKAVFAAGDVLYGKLRPYLNKVIVADAPGYCTTEIIPIRTFGFILPAYLCLALKRPEFIAYANSKSYGMNLPRLGTEDARLAPFPLPPLAEQKRIVAKVDELMALCDRLEAQQQERKERAAKLARASLARFTEAPTPANLNLLFYPQHKPESSSFIPHPSSFLVAPSDLRQSILTLAVQGKLVPQDPGDEPAEELFEKIQAERAQQEEKGAYKSVTSLPPIKEAEEPFKLPAEWKWARLRSLVFTLGDGLHGTPDYSDGTDCYFINGNNLIDGRIVIKNSTKTVSPEEAKKHRKPMTLSTLLVSINGTLGSVAFYNNENVILGKSACYFNLASSVDKHFVRRVIESPYFVNYASENATGTTIRNLGLKAMNYFPLPLPPLAEQRRIVTKVDQLMVLVDQLETQLTASRATAEKLLKAVVAELTSVSKGRTDET